MNKPKLYIFIGAPGAGKTAISQIITEKTGAHHLWADAERHRLFKQPTHAKEESDELYRRLNDAAEYLLAQGRDVVYDTNFNYYADRQTMREIAARQRAELVLIWVTTPKHVARERAVGEHLTRNGYMMSMTATQFESIVSKLEPPRKTEKIIKIDGTKLDRAAVLAHLGL